eukprot:5863441-Prymnesium_polylepis.2
MGYASWRMVKPMACRTPLARMGDASHSPVCARRHAVDRIVAAHQRAHAPLLDARLERREVAVDQVLVGDVRVGGVARVVNARHL